MVLAKRGIHINTYRGDFHPATGSNAYLALGVEKSRHCPGGGGLLFDGIMGMRCLHGWVYQLQFRNDGCILS